MAWICLWSGFGITFVRNVCVDLVQRRGRTHETGRWETSFSRIRPNLCSGQVFSVPLLTFVKVRVEDVFLFTSISQTTLPSRSFAFFGSVLRNGAYIAGHNRLRRFDEKVIKANFFRSVLCLASCDALLLSGRFHYGSLRRFRPSSGLTLWPSLIEGTGKSSSRFIFEEEISSKSCLNSFLKTGRNGRPPCSTTLYIWGKRTKGKASLRQVLQKPVSRLRNLSQPGQRSPILMNEKESPVHTGADYATKLKELFLRMGCFSTSWSSQSRIRREKRLSMIR